MPPIQIVEPTASGWDAFVGTRSDAHVLQTSAWGELKARFGWSVDRIALLQDDRMIGGALVLFRPLPLRLGTLAYIPKGPIVDLADAELGAALLRGLDHLARRRRAALLKVEPDASDPSVIDHLSRLGFRPSPQTVQPRRTIVIDLGRGEDDILAAMHHKTRYNIRLSARRGVTVRQATRADLPAFNRLMQVTGSRDGFGVHAPEYYEAAFDLFIPQERARLFVAEVESEIVAALFVFAAGRRAWYFYGASSDDHRKRMPNHALQWQAIRWARSIGCREYDMWGIPDEDEATLDAQYLDRRDGLWGVYRFKRGFGGRVVRHVGAYDRVYRPLLYRIYLLVLRKGAGDRG